MTGIRISLLGPVRAWRDDAELPLGPAQRRAVLAMLAGADGRAVTTEELIDGLWGEEPPNHAVAAIRNHVSGLRAALEEDRTAPQVLVSVGGGYALRLAPDGTDLAVFQQLTQDAARLRAEGDPAGAAARLHRALELTTGAPLADAPGGHAERQRERLAQLRLAVLHERLELGLELGRHAEQVDELAALVEEFPLHEGLAALLMTALYRSGRQAEARAAFAATCRALDTALGVEPTLALRELHERIRRGDPGLAAPAAAGQRTERPRPEQLPADASEFTGRQELVRSLAELIEQPPAFAPTIVAVAGMGGVGKTALAVHLARRVRHRFPDGQLYVNLRGGRPDPMEPGAVLVRFLRSLGVPESAVPDQLAERSALFRSLLAERRVLVVLDDARDLDQLRPLLPGSEHGAVLVTSRSSLLGLAPTRHVDLDVLEPGESLELFSRIAGRRRVAEEPDAARELLAACCHLPLAIRIVAARSALRPDWSLAAIGARLADRRQRLAELSLHDLAVEACFQLSYDQLTPRAAHAFRLLAVPQTADLSLPAAAAALELAEHAALDVLEDLVHAGLLESPAPDRYRYHDLLRLFAQARAEQLDSPQERAGLILRMVDQAVATAANAYRTVRPAHAIADAIGPVAVAGLTLPDRAGARRWLDEEGGNLLALAEQALGIAGAHRVVADLLLALDPHLEAGFRWRALIDVCRRTMQQAADRGDARAEGRAGYMLGGGLMQLGRWDEAGPIAARAADRARACRDLPVLGEVVNVCAMIAHLDRRTEDALVLHEETVRLADDCDSSWTKANALATSVVWHLARGEAQAADRAAEQSLTLFRALDDPFGEVYALHSAGRAARVLGDTERAVALHEQGLALADAHGFLVFEPMALVHLANCHLEAGRPAEAAERAEQAVTASRRLHRQDTETAALDLLGRV
ncbi:BTAD domain-containing putative transcriptional regulator [Kitasatospora sp. CM 4170]|uniref:BTAD domain-containing putative transcriptional regulator n=1 Tax=Kitasatospora aburaviensis TaxID=67265 RepID=A0ABW1F676_9ACTN|nr:BTAD domain-containing putative transcriptional regulator [Kitasatospora sp. CM 4170]WNM49149.1 BTAD domain-containing putative transcriptional regulator [Kitasatospora sp. CM 4170]